MKYCSLTQITKYNWAERSKVIEIMLVYNEDYELNYHS